MQIFVLILFGIFGGVLIGYLFTILSDNGHSGHHQTMKTKYSVQLAPHRYNFR